MGQRLSANLRTIDGVAILSLAGTLDAQLVEDLESSLEGVWDESVLVVLDLEALHAISSAGAGALVVAQREAERRGGALVLARPTGPVNHVLTTLGLHTMFSISTTLEEALGELRDRR